MKKNIGNWEFEVSNKKLHMRGDEINRLEEEIIIPWGNFFPKEGTWVEKEIGKPSLLIRLDMTRQADGSFSIFEVEERPSGIGITREVSPEFNYELMDIFQKWEKSYGEISIIVSKKREEGDSLLQCKMIL